MKHLLFAAAMLLLSHVARADSDDTPTANPNIQQVALVSTIKLASGSLPATAEVYGQVVAAPGAEITITLPASGIVSALPITTGQRVMADEAVAMIVPDAQSVAELHKAENAVKAARANRAHVAALLTSRLATSADLAAADQSLADAAATLAALNATSTGVARAVVAPQSGIVSAILTTPGSMQPAGAALLRIIGADSLVALVGATPAQAMTMKFGNTARVTILSTGAVLPANLTQLDGMVDPQTGLIGVTLALRGTPLLGASVDAVVTTGMLSGYIVPRDAVQTDQQGDYVFQIDEHNIAHRVAVHLLGTQGGKTILAPSLNTAMPMVTTGAYQLDDGAAVRLDGPTGAGP